MMDRYNKNIIRLVIHLTIEDPKFIKETIKKLEESGVIEKGSLAYLLNLARKWEKMANR